MLKVNDLSNLQYFAYKGYRVLLELKEEGFFSQKRVYNATITINDAVYQKVAEIIDAKRRKQLIFSSCLPSLNETINSIKACAPFKRVVQINVGAKFTFLHENAAYVNDAIKQVQSIIDNEGNVSKKFAQYLR